MRLAETRAAIEQRTLVASIAATLALACAGVVAGALTGSFAILFDGAYSAIDAAMSGLALLVARLIARDAARVAAGDDDDDTPPRRFQFGFWHLEPMALAFNATMLTVAALYGLGNALVVLLAGGQALAFDFALGYAAFAVAACLAMAWWEHRMNRVARSEFVALDSRSWLMSGAISGALVVAFGLGLAVEGGPHGWIAPYLDPAVLALVCLAILPLPLGALRDAARDVFLVAPGDLDAEVRAAAAAAAERHGFEDWRSYVARAGRSSQIEIYLIAAPGRGVRDLAELDAIRDEIGAEIGGRGPNRWLTIVFTTRRDWAD